jgi:drug/metabolite transporter (DMT)-like permease
MTHGPLKDYLKLHFIVLIWGFTGIIGSSVSIQAVNLVIYRTAIAGFVFFLMLSIKNARRGSTPKLSATHREKVSLICIGVLVGLHWCLFFAAVQAGSTSIGLLGLSTSSLWSALLRPVFEKKAISKLEVCLGLFVSIGLWIVVKAEPEFNLGLILSVAAGFVAANFSHLNGIAVKKQHELVMALYEMVGALLACWIVFPLLLKLLNSSFKLFEIPSLKDGILIFILAIVCTVYPYSASIELLRRISVYSANLAVNMEPIYGIILSAALLGEHKYLSGNFYLGTLIIVGLCCPGSFDTISWII